MFHSLEFVKRISDCTDTLLHKHEQTGFKTLNRTVEEGGTVWVDRELGLESFGEVQK